MNNKIHIIIIAYNKASLTLDCIRSIYDTCTLYSPEIIVVDNNSSDDTISLLKKNYPNIKLIINKKNLGYAKAINLGCKNLNTKFAIISNNDVIFHKFTIDKVIQFLENNNDIGVAGVQQLYPDGSYQISYGECPSYKLEYKNLIFINNIKKIFYKKFSKSKQVGYVDGAVMAVNMNAFNDVYGFDENYFFFTEEADFCFRLKQKGWKIVYIPDLFVTHYRGSDKKAFLENEDKLKMLISSKILFLIKYYSIYKTKKIVKLEILNINIRLLILKLLIKNNSDTAKVLKLYKKYWKIELNKL